MKGKDIKHWVLKRAKSTNSEAKGDLKQNVQRDRSFSAAAGASSSSSPDITMNLDSVTLTSGSPEPITPGKVTFSAKGTPFRIDPRYSYIRSLGVGAYGIVCAANDSLESRKVAVKKVTNVFDDLTDAKRIIREIRLLSSMNHDNVLQIIDIDEPESYNSFADVYIITELMDTDLNKLLRSKHPLLDVQRKFFCYQIFRALKYIHSANILHRDLKPANVLVSESCDIKICDFGLARYVDPGDGPAQQMTEYVVTRWYRAPELLLAGDDYTSAIDMWSAGCLLAELYSRRPIFPGRDVKNQIEIICRMVGKPTAEDIKTIPNRRAREFISGLPDTPRMEMSRLLPDACPLACDLIEKLLQFDPARRLSAKDALQHPFVAEYRDKETEITAGDSVDLRSLEPPNERQIGRAGIRRLMWDEMLKFHPSARFREPASAIAAEKQLRELISQQRVK